MWSIEEVNNFYDKYVFVEELRIPWYPVVQGQMSIIHDGYCINIRPSSYHEQGRITKSEFLESLNQALCTSRKIRVFKNGIELFHPTVSIPFSIVNVTLRKNHHSIPMNELKTILCDDTMLVYEQLNGNYNKLHFVIVSLKNELNWYVKAFQDLIPVKYVPIITAFKESSKLYKFHIIFPTVVTREEQEKYNFLFRTRFPYVKGFMCMLHNQLLLPYGRSGGKVLCRLNTSLAYPNMIQCPHLSDFIVQSPHMNETKNKLPSIQNLIEKVDVRKAKPKPE